MFQTSAVVQHIPRGGIVGGGTLVSKQHLVFRGLDPGFLRAWPCRWPASFHVLDRGPKCGPLPTSLGGKGGPPIPPGIAIQWFWPPARRAKIVLGPSALREVWPWRAQQRGSPRPRTRGVVSGPPFPHGTLSFVCSAPVATRQGVALTPYLKGLHSRPQAARKHRAPQTCLPGPPF
jgi:hypothetical protein